MRTAYSQALVFFLTAALCAPSIAFAQDLSSTNYQVLAPMIGASGIYATSTSFSVLGLLSEVAHGAANSTSFGFNLGFAAYPFVSTPVVSATGGDASAALSWTAASGALGYAVSGYSVGQSATPNGLYVFTAVGDVLAYSASSLTNGRPYYFVVRVLDSQGNTIATSSEVSATPAVSVVTPAPASGGGGGGGTIIPTVSSGATVNFSGRAYPNSTVVLLKDGQIALSAPAGGDARFGLTLSGLSAGSYIFSVYGIDSTGAKSTLLSFPETLSTGATTNVGGIFVSPTIDVNKSEVKKGDNLTIFGETSAASAVTISVHSDPELFLTTTSDKDGAYLYTLDTSPLEYGTHLAKSKAALAGQISNFGAAVGFTVGTETVQKAKKSILGDLARHGRVNLIDFSIMVYWFGRTISGNGVASDLNGDGKVDLTDLSILAAHWTG